jgi:hypothetical protein
MLSDLFKKSKGKPQPTSEEVEVVAKSVYTGVEVVEAVDDSFSYKALLVLISRVSGLSVEKLEPMTQDELLDFIALGYWPNEQHLSIRKRNNERMTKKD